MVLFDMFLFVYTVLKWFREGTLWALYLLKGLTTFKSVHV